MDDPLDGLTQEQLEAVTHGNGPLLIVAGAGTGKTTVLTRRVAHLIRSGAAKSSEVLALTFTDKAAQEMQGRIDELLPLGYADTTVCTFHSFGDRILRQYALEIGLAQDYRMLDDTGQVLFLRRFLFDLPLQRLRPLGNPTTHLRALKSHFSKLKEECIEPATYLAWAEQLHRAAQGLPAAMEQAELQWEMARCYDSYQQLLAREGRCDFSDLVYRPLQLLRQHPHILQRVQRQFRYILVDEFQDTNGSQFELVRLLAAEHRNLSVVGDDDQSIYAFRGAAIGNILSFLEHYPDSRQVVLTHNYRSLQPILEASYTLIQANNPGRLEVINNIDKRLRAARTDLTPLGPEAIELHRFETVSEEAEAVARRIAEWSLQYDLGLDRFALLVRNNNDASPFLRALNALDIAYRFSGNEGLYRRAEVRLIVSIIHVLCDPHDGQALFYLLTHDFYAASARDLVRLANLAKREHRPLLQQLERLLAEPPADYESLPVLQGFFNDYREFVEHIPKLPPGTLIYQFLQRSPWWTRLTRGEVDNAQAIVQNIARFFDVVSRYSEEHPEGNLADFVNHLDLLIESGDSPSVVESDSLDEAVQVLTIHRSKGLEFPVVFVVGLNDERFPGRPRGEDLEFPWPLLADHARDDQDFVREERRLFYVALTRAQQHLWLSGSNDTGSRRKNRPSRFVSEALGRKAVRTLAPQLPSMERIRRAAPVEPARRPLPRKDHPLVLTQQAIHDYQECPHRYYLGHILRIPQPESHQFSYGTALHESISWFLKQVKEEGRTPSEEELVERFHGLWSQVGCLSPEHARARREQGELTLRRFWAEEVARPQVPHLIEQEFRVRLQDISIRGRIDRVDLIEGKARLIDYKTSAVYQADKAAEQARQSLQLSIYGMALKFQHQLEPQELCLHFLESGLRGVSRWDDHPFEQHTESILETARGIRHGHFPARPSQQRCQSCSYRSVCDER